ncbi:MAG: transcription antitermination factor NusB [Treponema sp.]|nr:transcription antitermination factor NusB [Treponema sp.]
MSRRIGRILAFQALYSWSVGGVPQEDLTTFSWIERDSSEDADAQGDEVEAVDGEIPSDGVKYCLQDKQLELFEKLSPDKKQEIFAFATLLIRGTLEHIDEVDALIKSHLSAKWSMDRINKVALSVIRMSVYSLLYQKDTHSSVIIDEAVEIVKDYGADDSHKFTNAVLDKISKDIAK